MTAILGISAFYHDSAATLVVDGEIVAAAQEERFTRKKHDPGFPTGAIAYCLDAAGISADDLDHVGFYEKPLQKFDRLLETYLSFAPVGYRSFLKAMPQWVGQKLHLRREIHRGLNHRYRGRICYCSHHQSHAASAFFPSPFDQSAILTMDGVGEWATSSLGIGRGNQIQLLKQMQFPDSLGLLYSAFTYYTGFRVNSGEYKLMGLAPYGQPRYADLIRQRLIDLKDDGSFRLNLDYFRYCQGLTMTSRRFDKLFGRGRRTPQSPIETLDMDLAASIQAVTEEVVLKTARHLHQITGLSQLSLAGGVALNCVANGRLQREGPFDDIWIQPAAGDAGGSLGVAQLIWYQLLERPRSPQHPDAQSGSLLGPAFDPATVASTLDQLGANYRQFSDRAELTEAVADQLASGKVIGRLQGRMEFGPRALGNRSILGDPRRSDMQSVMNRKIKYRESFRPFAPIVLADCASEYFNIPAGVDSPYMLLVYDVADRIRLDTAESSDSGLARVNQSRSQLPAITHVDHSARLQTVDAMRNPGLEQLLRAFYRRTGCPVLINTSFNVRGEPIVCTPQDAYRCFMATEMDVLVVENCLLYKHDQPQADAGDIEQYMGDFELD